MSEACYDFMLLIIKSMLPENENLFENFYQSKKIVMELGLSYKKIDVCLNDSILYYKDDEEKKKCSACEPNKENNME